ncbi:MAG: hypothetical protein JEY79_04575 [Pseudodesulfovibrio sp.]|nr:hypothetical protein [Pseudodesulfovibrio sp.]
MKKLIVLVAVVALGLMLGGCGAQKNELDKGYTLVQAGDCAGAGPYLEDTIANPDGIMDLAYAYFLKGKCAEKAGDAAMAYENYYASKIVACYAVSNDIHVNLNTYGRSEFCERIIPQMLKKIAPDVGEASKVEAITDKVDGILTARYMERFKSNLQ